MSDPYIPFSTPSLSVLQANILAGLVGISYVGSLYLSKHTRPRFSSAPQDGNHVPIKGRDHPDVIRARLIVVSLSTITSCMMVLGVTWYLMGCTAESFTVALASTAERLGLTVSISMLLPCLISPALFLGPLYVLCLCRSLPLQSEWSISKTVVPLFTTLQGLRNHVVAPITEEVGFRACILSVYHMAGCSSQKMIFYSPLWFGIAHVHHGREIYHRFGRTNVALQRAILQVVFQLAYTTLFGFHCAYLFLRTGSLLPPIASHVFCNIMGFPGFTSDLALFPQKRTSIITAYLLGVVAYIYTLGAWTKGYTSLYWPTDPSFVQY